MQQIRAIFFRGLLTFLPIAITIYILYTGVLIVENLLGGVIRTIIPETYIPGLGFLITVIVVFIFGLMLNNLLIGELLQRLERRLQSIPLIKAVYSPLRDLMNLFSKKGQQDMKAVVLVELGPEGLQALGLVTRESFKDLQEMKDQTQGKVAVYIPWSYGLGGLTFLVPKQRLHPVDIPVDRALSLALTAWVKSHDDSLPNDLEKKP
ncbi:MAG: DUF502 domain-containing protein [Bdellovibrionaceae bacterium]|nr:DUF502 domain-containing protein [Pseudobdellovibrionaceae bacterium]MBX3033160.1 DUF502 domain-containing protein [Pseudobdellovibrionaceae bacterium]